MVMKGRNGVFRETPQVSQTRQVVNFVGCVFAGGMYFYYFLYSTVPLTLDMLVTIVLAEYCRWSNERRRLRSIQRLENSSPSLVEEAEPRRQSLDCFAAVVGFREEPSLFEKALRSYAGAQSCRFLLVCIDGDEKEDQTMIDTFSKVYPNQSTVLHFEVPIAEIALQMDRERQRSTSDEDIITRCRLIVSKTLEDSNITFTGLNAVTSLCVSQPHMHKKGIMFTSFIVSLVISDILGVDFLWTSDSDSMVTVDTLKRTVASFASDPNIGGASTALSIHNKDKTMITKFGNAIFLIEMYLMRCLPASVAANDCQSGPCAAFRFTAIEGELLAWYKQSVFGHWMVVNEDRHLTTRLLLKGWRVVFACDVLTATETPETLRRWLLQQVRWARAIHIETFHEPRVYLMQSPILFFAALRRQFSSFVVPCTILLYLCTGVAVLRPLSFWDYLQRRMFTIAYLALRSPYRPSTAEWLWSIPANVFFNICLPAISFWSFLTVFSDSWGTNMRYGREILYKSPLRLKFWEVGFFIVWIGILGGAAGRYFATTLVPNMFSVGACAMVGMVPIWLILAYFMVLAD